jgi:DNA-binding CsgD family transcriptional regulator
VTERTSKGRPPHPDILIPAEWRVAEAVRQGTTNRLIAQRQGRTLDAVKYYVANVLQKLGFSSRAAHEDLAARGIAFVSAPHMIHRHDDGTEEWMAFFNDNEGRYLAIMSQVVA